MKVSPVVKSGHATAKRWLVLGEHNLHIGYKSSLTYFAFISSRKIQLRCHITFLLLSL
jgi:hypothetical protein